MAFISVVIPVYNAKQFLSDTVKSVLTQPYRDIEIVLVNDGSNDGSAELCDELANENDRIHVIHQKNAGVSVARNTGIEYILCNKKEQSYIAFLDADDMWCKNVITSSLVQELRDEDSDIVGFSSYKANYAATKMNILSEYKNEVVVFPIQYQTEIIWAKGHFGAHLYHIRVFEKNRIEFDPKCRLNEDVIFAAKMFFCSMKFSFKDIYIYIYI